MFKNLFKKAPDFISNLFAGAVSLFTGIIAFAPKATEAFELTNCPDCIATTAKVAAVATVGLGVVKIFSAEKEVTEVPAPPVVSAPVEDSTEK